MIEVSSASWYFCTWQSCSIYTKYNGAFLFIMKKPLCPRSSLIVGLSFVIDKLYFHASMLWIGLFYFFQRKESIFQASQNQTWRQSRNFEYFGHIFNITNCPGIVFYYIIFVPVKHRHPSWEKVSLLLASLLTGAWHPYNNGNEVFILSAVLSTHFRNGILGTICLKRCLSKY